MKSLALVVFVTAFSIPLLQGNTHEPANSLSLSISAQQASLRSGSDIKVKTRLTNISDHQITIMDTRRDCDYPVQVRDANGVLVPDTGYKRQLNCTGGGVINRNIQITLKPREFREDEIVVSDFSDMARPGKYLVQIMRKIPTELGKEPVKSNVITITVIN